MGANAEEPKSIEYFMGRVDNQLSQIQVLLEEVRGDVKEVAKVQTSQGTELESLEKRVTTLEVWKEKAPETSDFVRWSTLREKITVPIIVAVVLFLLTTVGPALVILLNK